MSSIEKLADAIQAAEGWGTGSLSQRLNNPGLLRRWGGMPRVEGYVKFETYDQGRQALIQLLENAAQGKSTIYSPHDTIEDFVNKYGPAGDHEQLDEYIQTIVETVELPKETPLRHLLPPAGSLARSLI